MNTAAVLYVLVHTFYLTQGGHYMLADEELMPIDDCAQKAEDSQLRARDYVKNNANLTHMRSDCAWVKGQ